MFTLILFAFTPLPWAFIPSHINKEGQHHVDGDHCNNSSIKIAVPIGHPKGAYEEKKVSILFQIYKNIKIKTYYFYYLYIYLTSQTIKKEYLVWR